MPTHGPDLGRLTVSQLSAVSGVTEKTCIKRLRAAGIEPVARDGRALYFAPPAALRAIFGQRDGVAERARFDAARAEREEVRNRVERGDLVPAADLDRVLIALATTVSGRLQGLPARLAQHLAAESSAAGCQAIVAEAVDEALHDLASRGDEARARSTTPATAARKANGG